MARRALCKYLIVTAGKDLMMHVPRDLQFGANSPPLNTQQSATPFTCVVASA